MSKKVLIISGSPRKGGNSDILCDRFMQGAEEAGNTVERYFFMTWRSDTAWHAMAAEEQRNVYRRMIWNCFLIRW